MTSNSFQLVDAAALDTPAEVPPVAPAGDSLTYARTSSSSPGRVQGTSDVGAGAHGEGAPAPTCSIDGCDRDVRARGWCSAHYRRWARTGDPLGSRGRSPRVDSWMHGSRRGYDLGCRCFPCRRENNRYQEAWRHGSPARTPAPEVAAHLRELIRSGWTRTSIADEAGVERTAPWRILSGYTKSVNSRTAEALLSLQPFTGTITLDAAPLLRAIEARGENIRATLRNEADRRAYYRALESGEITDVMADRLAIGALGLTLEVIYGPDWDEVAA